MIQSLLASLEPNAQDLLSDISKHIDDDMLAEIASADYGQDQEQHLAALRHLRDTGSFIEPMYWYPCEVLELVRHSPEGSIDIQGHWIRAFACAALLRANEEPWNYSCSSSNLQSHPTDQKHSGFANKFYSPSSPHVGLHDVAP